MSVFGFNFENMFVHLLGRLGGNLIDGKSGILDLARVFDRLELEQQHDGIDALLVEMLDSIERHVEYGVQVAFGHTLNGRRGDALKVKSFTSVLDERVIVQVLVHV